MMNNLKFENLVGGSDSTGLGDEEWRLWADNPGTTYLPKNGLY